MKTTVFNTPVIRLIAPIFGRAVLFCLGWKVKGKMPDVPKCVIIGAPHTSTWDYFYAIMAAFVLKAQIHAMGKISLTEGPFGFVMRWLGIIPIDRSKNKNMTGLTIEQFEKNEELIIIVSPAGTIAKVDRWKTGFYYIAHGAQVPISLGFLDYDRREIGAGQLFYPTGDIKADMKEIRKFYADIKGKFPERQIQD